MFKHLTEDTEAAGTHKIKKCLNTCPTNHFYENSTHLCTLLCSKTGLDRFKSSLKCEQDCPARYTGRNTQRYFYLSSDDEYVCTTGCNLIEMLNGTQTSDAVLAQSQFEEQDQIIGVSGSASAPTLSHTQCKKSEDCNNLFNKNDVGDTYFMCTRTCSYNTNLGSNVDSTGALDKHRTKIFRYGVGGPGASPTSEYCTSTCSGTDRPYWFVNSDGDKECTSDCAPPLIETNRKVSNTNRDTITLLYTLENSATDKECVPDCQIFDSTDVDLHQLYGATRDGYCSGFCDISGSSLSKFRSLVTVVPPIDPAHSNQTPSSVVEQVCSGSCATLEGGNFHFLFDLNTSGTTDDQILCVQQCPPAIGDVTKYYSAFAGNSGVTNTIALFKLMVPSIDPIRECLRRCPNTLFKKIPANNQPNTFTCVQACDAD